MFIHTIGFVYYNTKDYKNAKKFFKLCCEQNDAASYEIFGTLYSRENDHKKSL
ncbi:MAG: hypothetical protein K2P17_06840 [Helicobacteraceae bacterium]|nr:hypothetical protein [Helicobacteraceae bacterium]